MKPILKWAGGKRQLINTLQPYLPEQFNTYFEPFLGGGALLFKLAPDKAVVNDLNAELINMYEIIKDNPHDLISALEIHKDNHCHDYYYRIRQLDREPGFSEYDPVKKAARTIYLNRTCFNGLFRVNQQGFFNTPIGRYTNPKIVDSENILEVSQYLNKRGVKLYCGDYVKSLLKARTGDFVYLDPPYDPLSATSSFTDYTKNGFDKNDQCRLKDECDRLNALGVKFMQSNSRTDFLLDLYKDYKIIEIDAFRMINSKAAKRSGLKEIIITNY